MPARAIEVSGRMSSGFQFLDILVFAMVAGFLLLRLHRVLGRRTGHERRPPDSLNDGEERVENVVTLTDKRGESDRTPADTGPAGLTQIRIADPNFNDEDFLDGARGAFEMILSAFARSDKRQLKPLLSQTIYEQFAAEIDRHEGEDLKLETTLVSIILADIIDAGVEKRTAHVTVKLISEQINVTRDAEGEIVEGDPSRVDKITDIWTFARDTRSSDPNWQLIETRSES